MKKQATTGTLRITTSGEWVITIPADTDTDSITYKEEGSKKISRATYCADHVSEKYTLDGAEMIDITAWTDIDLVPVQKREAQAQFVDDENVANPEMPVMVPFFTSQH